MRWVVRTWKDRLYLPRRGCRAIALYAKLRDYMIPRRQIQSRHADVRLKQVQSIPSRSVLMVFTEEWRAGGRQPPTQWGAATEDSLLQPVRRAVDSRAVEGLQCDR